MILGIVADLAAIGDAERGVGRDREVEARFHHRRVARDRGARDHEIG